MSRGSYGGGRGGSNNYDRSDGEPFSSRGTYGGGRGGSNGYGNDSRDRSREDGSTFPSRGSYGGGRGTSGGYDAPSSRGSYGGGRGGSNSYDRPREDREPISSRGAYGSGRGISGGNDDRSREDREPVSSRGSYGGGRGASGGYDDRSNGYGAPSSRGTYDSGRGASNGYGNDGGDRHREDGASVASRGSYGSGRGGSNNYDRSREDGSSFPSRGSYGGGRGGSNSYDRLREDGTPFSSRGAYGSGRGTSGGNDDRSTEDGARFASRGSYGGGRGTSGRYDDRSNGNDAPSSRGTYGSGRGGANNYDRPREAPFSSRGSYGGGRGDSNGYGNDSRDRSREDGSTFPSRGSYGGGRGTSGGYDAPSSRGSYGGGRGGSNSYDRPRDDGEPSRGSYGGGRGTSGGYDDRSNGNDAPSSRGTYSSGRSGSNNYDRPRENETPFSSRGSYGGGRGGYDNDRTSYGFGSRSGGSDNDRPNGFGGPPRGSFSSGRGGGGRYDDRRNDENNGRSGYSGYSGFGQLEDGRKEFTEENHAPRDYKPVDRDVEDIFAEDKEDVHKNAATIFDGDADVLVEDTDVQMHYDTWQEMELDEQLLANIINSDYVKPRKIQQKTIPYILEGYDVKCQGETGSGKTAAFLIPVIQKLLEQSKEGQLPRSNPICIIVAPTRELVSQIFDQAKKFTNKTGITVARAYGEYAVRTNIADIRNGCNILVACVGRLMHLVRNGEFGLRDLKYLILDEADRLLMENFNSDILQLFQWPEIPKGEDRQTLLFSATLRDPVVMDLTKEYLRKKSVLITVSCQSNKRVQYKVYAVPNVASKFRYLVNYMKRITEENDGVVPRTLIFVNRKINTDRVAIECTNNKFPATTIHGDRGQHLREEALSSFRSGKTKCLVATDVCARGVDIKEMDHVINYDLPSESDNFVQRCGRTGRTHNGIAMSFYLEDEDRTIASTISTIIQQNGQEAPKFLLDSVSRDDYNFGEGELPEDDEPQKNEQSYDNQNGSRSNSAVSPPNDDATISPPPGFNRNPTPQPIVDPLADADDGWD